MIRTAKSLMPLREIGPKDAVGPVLTSAADTRWRGMEKAER